MKRKNRIRIGALALAASALLASSATAGGKQASLLIRHQSHGCHAWSFNHGAFKPSLKINLTRGTTLTVTDSDVMPHKLLQLSGAKLHIVTPAMGHVGATAKVTFLKKGTYRFTTKPGEDYVAGIKTIGEDNVLRLTVTVS
jgi:plastocyanin